MVLVIVMNKKVVDNWYICFSTIIQRLAQVSDFFYLHSLLLGMNVVISDIGCFFFLFFFFLIFILFFFYFLINIKRNR